MNSLIALLWVIVPFLIMLGVLIFVHELGHFVAAKIFKVKVLVFAFGFGPWLIHKKIGETDYGIKPIPLGGYVRLFGDPSEQEEETGEPVTPEDAKRALFAQATWKKMIIFGAGSLMNIALAFVIAPAVYWIGIEQPYTEVAAPSAGMVLPDSPADRAGIKPGDLVLRVNGKQLKNFQQMITMEMLNPEHEMTYQIQRGDSVFEKKVKLALSEAEGAGYSGIFLPGIPPVVGGILKGGAAAKAGLQPEDKVISVNGRPVGYWHEMTALVQQSQGRPLVVVVERDRRQISFNLTPEYRDEEKRYLIGIEQKIPEVFVRYGFLEGLQAGFGEAYYWAGLTVRVAGKLLSLQLSRKAISGPVGIAAITGAAAKAGISRFLLLLIIISVNLGIINLVPIPPLDGGHLVITLIEAITRRSMNKKVKEIIFQTTFLLMIAFMLFVTFNDLVRFQQPIADWLKELVKSFGIK